MSIFNTSRGREDRDYNSNNSSSQPFNEEFQRLRDLISSNIFGISSNATSLEKALRTIGNPGDTRILRLELQAVQNSTKVTITHTSNDLKRLKSMTESGGDSGKQKLVVNRLEADFRSHVERFTSLQKKIVAKMKAIPLPQPPTPESIGDEDDLQLVKNEETEHQIFENQSVDFDLALAVERASRVQQIESDIVDIHEIMTQLGSMVNEQGETIDNIAQHIEDAHIDVEAGTQQLQQAAKLQTSRRKCILGIAVVGVIIVVVLVVVVLTEFKS